MGAKLAVNDHRRPATPSHTKPCNTWPDGTSSPVRYHPAILWACLTVKQVHREFVLGLLTRDIGGTTTTGQVAATVIGKLTPCVGTPARPPSPGGRPSTCTRLAHPSSGGGTVRTAARRWVFDVQVAEIRVLGVHLEEGAGGHRPAYHPPGPRPEPPSRQAGRAVPRPGVTTQSSPTPRSSARPRNSTATMRSFEQVFAQVTDQPRAPAIWIVRGQRRLAHLRRIVHRRRRCLLLPGS